VNKNRQNARLALDVAQAFERSAAAWIAADLELLEELEAGRAPSAQALAVKLAEARAAHALHAQHAGLLARLRKAMGVR
jgi:hypothetical protein